ncbi:hypothetical protein BGX26_000804 [Mortierella sp. AD094]|nr:hypothetical protein BGX26_000804 [Mortierella sp. AD094]
MSQPALDQEPEQPGPSPDVIPSMEDGGKPSWSDEDYQDDYEEEDCKESYEEEYDDYEQDYDDEYDDSEYFEDDDGDPHSGLYGDFSVSTKTLPRAGFKTSTQPTRSLSNAISPIPQKQYHLIFKGVRPIPPEILHLIFSYTDHRTLCRSINRASRQFNAIAKHYIELEGTWTLGTQKEEDDLLEKMRSNSVNVLRIKYIPTHSRTEGRLPPFDTWEGAFKRFIDLITAPIHRNRGSSPNTNPSAVDGLADSTAGISLNEWDPKPPCLLDRVKKVIIDDPALPALLPYLHRIHTLETHDQGWRGYHDIHLLPILKACLNLDTLTIHGFHYEKLWIGWSNDDSTTDAEEARPIKSRLTRFTTKYEVSMCQDTITALLGACPHLTHFKAWDVHIRGPGATSGSTLLISYVMSRPIAPVYRQAARLCPNMQSFSIKPIRPARSDTLAHRLALTAELFPRTQHMDVEFQLPDDDDWSLDGRTAEFLARLTSIYFVSIPLTHSARSMDRLLRHCRKLTHLDAQTVIYSRPPPPSLSRGFLAQSSSSSWRCPRLRVLKLSMSRSTTATEDADVFRFLAHACPNLEELYLNLGTLRVGQEEMIVKTNEAHRTVKWTLIRRYKRSTYTERLKEENMSCVWQEHKNVFRMLGQLRRLEKLEVRVDTVPGVLYPSHFAFLRDSNNGRGDQDREAVFCPRLQSMRIRSWKPIAFGKAREKPFSEGKFVNALKAIRPKMAIAFK